MWPGVGRRARVAYRREIAVHGRSGWPCSAASSLVGGLLGALLLVRTSDTSFMRLLPWLMLARAVTFTFGGRDRGAAHAERARGARTACAVIGDRSPCSSRSPSTAATSAAAWAS